MAIFAYGSKAQLDSDKHIGTLITPGDLNNLLDTIVPPLSSYAVADTDGDTSFVNDPVQLLLVNDELATRNALESLTPNAFGGFDNISAYATQVTNEVPGPFIVDAVHSAYIQLQGAATVDGGYASTFIVDASKDASDVLLNASSVKGSYSWLVGGSGNDTLNGSMSSTGSAVLGSPTGGDTGATSMFGGLGAATMYGGGHTTMTAGDHVGQFLAGSDIASTVSGAGQALYDFTYGATDSMVAGTGGYNTLSVTSGNHSVLDDRAGNGTDYVFAGGNDTIYGSSAGTTITTTGSSSILSAGADKITVGAGGNFDTITAGSSVDTVTFQGHSAAQVQSLVDAQVAATGKTDVTIHFTTSSGALSGQSATLNNVHNIKFTDG